MSNSENLRNSEAESFNLDSVEAIANELIRYHAKRGGKDKKRIVEVRRRIADFSESYLKRISYGIEQKTIEQVQGKIDVMRNSDPDDTIILMSAHQPNLFAYSGVLRKMALLKAVEQRLIDKGISQNDIICFYGFADHDFVHNKWVRSAEMSAPLKREGILRFNISVDKKDLFMPSNKIEKPSKEKLELWRKQISGWIVENCSLAIKYAKAYDIGINPSEMLKIANSNFAQFWQSVEKANLNASSLAEFSSFLLATIAQAAFETPIVFANYSDCYGAFGDEYLWLLSNAKIYLETVEKSEANLKEKGIHSGLSEDVGELLPVWLKCSCGSKYRMAMGSSMVFSGKCMHCDKDVTYTYEGLMALAKSSPQLFEPRSVSMALIFAKAFDMSFYVGGAGGVGYLMHTAAVSKELKSPLPPISYWGATDKYMGIETLASSFEAERIAASYGLSPVKNSADNIAEAAGKAAIELGDKMAGGLVPKSAISQRAMQLLETIQKSLKMQSCSIGYAINIGLGSTYRQWVDFLLANNNLQEQVKLKSILIR